MAAGQGMKGGSLANLDHSKDFRLYPKSSKKQLKGWEAGICQDNLFFFFFFSLQKCSWHCGQWMGDGPKVDLRTPVRGLL